MEKLPLKNSSSDDKTDVSQQAENGRQELNVQSAEVQQIIGRPPHWLVRSGIGGLLGVLILILGGAALMKYPDVIEVPLRLTAINAPKTVPSKISGKLIKLLIDNGTYAEQGQLLGWMESTAQTKEVLKLSKKVDSVQVWIVRHKTNEIKAIDWSHFSGLGELQQSFQTFEQKYRQFTAYLPGAYYDQKKAMLKRELKYNRLMLKSLKTRKNVRQKQYTLARQEYNMKEKLNEKELIAPLEFMKQREQFLNSRLPLQQSKSAIISNRTAQINKQELLVELNEKMRQQKSAFLQSLYTLQSAIANWKDRYLLVAPVSGKVVYSGIIQENQNFKTGQPVFYIKPSNTHFFGEVWIPQHAFGKIHKGQKVLVRLSGYPYEEFGSVAGRVSYLSAIPVKDSSFVAKISFPNGLDTDYGKTITPEDGMTGLAKIITNDRRLLARLYANIVNNL